MLLHEDRLFPAEPNVREIARRLFNSIRDLPLICPHGHTDPAWFAENKNFTDPAHLLIVPDHYVLRLLVSQGVPLAQLGVPETGGAVAEPDSRAIWRLFAAHYHLFQSTPTRLWLDYTFQNLFGLTVPLTRSNADSYFDQISDCLAQDSFKPRALYERSNIEVIATTENPLDTLPHHTALKASDWTGRVISAYRPDCVTDPDFEGFADNIRDFGTLANEDVSQWQGYLNAHRNRRAYFASLGATSTDHGHPTAQTVDLSQADASTLYQRVISGKADAAARALFRAQMLTEMAAMSIEDGLIMQLHCGSRRNHSRAIFEQFGRDKGFDIPGPTGYVQELQPLLDRFGMDPRLTIVLFTLDESAYSRELAPLAGAYPSLILGPAWWFFDSPDGMMRYRERVTETAGYYNTAGFNDDTRSFPSIAARHDVARRVDSAFLARQVAEHRLPEDAAAGIAYELAYGLAKRTYKL